MEIDVKKILLDNFKIDKSLINLSDTVMEEIEPYIKELSGITEYNQLKVIQSMISSNVGDFHLNDSTGYGYGDIGRECIEGVYSRVFGAEDALVRPQIVSGTHAIALCLFGVLRPGDELLSVTGEPYDSLKDTISGENVGSLANFHINYSKVDLADGKPDYKAIEESISDKTKMVLIQRSKGYSLRDALSIKEIGKIIKKVKSVNKDIVCFVDNCYGEFVDTMEPSEVGADLCAGSLIKNPGGGIAPTGGYIVGKRDLIEQCIYRLYAPGLDKDCGPTIATNRLTLQGLFLAPLIVGEVLKGSIFISRLLEHLNFDVYPKFNEKRHDIVTSVVLGNPELLISFCQGFQKAGPIDAKVLPEPWAMPGYENEVIMAGGSFIQGASIELSVDAPIRKPYVAYIQGGLNFTHIKLGTLLALQEVIEKGFLHLPIKTNDLS